MYPDAPGTAVHTSRTESGQAQSTAIPEGTLMIAKDESLSSELPFLLTLTFTAPDTILGTDQLYCCVVCEGVAINVQVVPLSALYSIT